MCVCVCLVQQLLEHAQQHNYLLMKSSNCESSKLHKLKTRQANEISKTKRNETKLRNFHGCHSVSHKCMYVYMHVCVCVCSFAESQTTSLFRYPASHLSTGSGRRVKESNDYDSFSLSRSRDTYRS